MRKIPIKRVRNLKQIPLAEGSNKLYYIKLFVKIIFLVILQTLISPYIKIFDIIPDFFLCVVLISALSDKSLVKLMVFSSLLGIIMDSMCARIFGLYICVYLISAVIAYSIKESVFKSGVIINMITFFVVCVISKSVFYLMNISVLKDFGYGYYLFGVIIPESLYNSVIFIVYTFIKKLKSKVGVKK